MSVSPADSSSSSGRVIFLDGYSLTCAELCQIGSDPDIRVDLSPSAWARIGRSRAVVDKILQDDSPGSVPVYGINTGFGNFASVRIPHEDLIALQYNLIRSHCCGVGAPLSRAHTRRLCAVRLNVFCLGCSGISKETVAVMLAALNANALSVIPCQGTVGASGDLAPLAHLALGLLGEGNMWNPDGKSDNFMPAAEALAKVGIKPMTLGAKEGLALINGTALISSLGAEAVERARKVQRQADVIAAMTTEAVKGSTRPFQARIHKMRPHTGQIKVAARMRTLLGVESARRDDDDDAEEAVNLSRTRSASYSPISPPGSAIQASHVCCSRVQDSYTIRCIPQVHGIVYDTIQFVEGIIVQEINSATDNPMIFMDNPEEQNQSFYGPDSRNSSSSTQVSSILSQLPPASGFLLSGGNFHGEYPAKVLDYLSIGIHEISSISERRIERLINSALSNGLPSFLIPNGGLNSGFMMAHVTAAALVAENRQLANPASTDSIPTSANQEDHVSMGGWAARKSLKILENVETVIAIELLAACQAFDFLRPLRSTPMLEKVYSLVRSEIPFMEKDRIFSDDIEKAKKIIRENRVWEAVREEFPEELY